MTLETVLVLHATAAAFMTGLIWFVQVAHYPLFPRVGDEAFVGYERSYMSRVTVVVMPVMLAELALGVQLWWVAPPALAPWPLVGLLLLAVVWASTFLLQVPCHRALSERADRRVMRRLVRTNWLRTAAWTLRTALGVALLLAA